MNSHINKCMDSIHKSCANRKAKIVKAYQKKEGRTKETLGTIKTAAAVIGYGLYAGMPTGLREYDVYDGIEQPLDSPTLPDQTDTA